MILRDSLNGNTMFYETFVCFYVSEQNPFVSVFVHKYLRVLNEVECTTFKMFVTQMSNYLFVISFQLMFYKTLRCILTRPLDSLHRFTFLIVFSAVLWLCSDQIRAASQIRAEAVISLVRLGQGLYPVR